ncbi:MAG: nitroreductase family protein [Armatimonadota bacterium]
MDLADPINHIRLDADRCTRCGACSRVCPVVRFGGVAGVKEVPRDYCLQCGHCAAVCPHGAVLHPAFPAESLRPVTVSSPDTIEQILRARRSVRHFDDRRVERAHWEALLAQMTLAPSGMNARPVRAMVVTDAEKLAALTRLTADFYEGLLGLLKTSLNRMALRLAIGKDGLAMLRGNAEKLGVVCRLVREGEDPILYRAPGALILHAERTAACGHDDCQLAAMAGMLAAPALGLGTCMIGFLLPPFQRLPALRNLVKLPASHEVYAVLAVGYPTVQYQYAPPRPEIPVTWQ